jgi:threonine/homoserine/homoserine lactone efflux protein
MDAVVVLAVVAGVHLAATVVPGPTTLVVVRSALARSRRAAAAVAMGVMAADTVWALAAMGGISLVFARYPWLHRTLGAAGGVYLLYLAVKTWLSAHQDLVGAPVRHGGRASFASGAMTNVANPKSVVFFGSIFAATLPPGATIELRMSAVAVVAFNALWWHLALGFVFSMPRAHQLYAPLKKLIDRVTASVIGLFGAALLGEAR